jgi:hypothetical protein
MSLHSYRQMLWKRLKSWLGWDADPGLLSFTDVEPRPRIAPPPAPKVAVKTHARPTEPVPAAAQSRTKTDRAPLDVLDNPRLTLNKPADDGFDPYNTGAFNRSASWERIGRQRKR